MSATAILRTLACSRVVRRAQGRGAGTTTERWQDKRAHIVRRSGGWFCCVFRRVAHLAALLANVQCKPNTLLLFDLSHIAGPRHGR